MNMEWMEEAITRLVEEVEHAQGHFQDMKRVIDEWKERIEGGMSFEDFHQAAMDEDDALVVASYGYISHLFLIHGAVMTMIRESWESDCIPMEVKAEVAKFQIEMMTGEPYRVVNQIVGPSGQVGFQLQHEEVEIPDTLEGFDE